MRCVVIGESLVDLIGQPGSWDFTAKPGGSPLNVAVALSRLDAQVEFITETGDDLFGGLLRDHLSSNRVTVTGIGAASATSLAIARLSEEGSATYDFRFTWAVSSDPDLTGVDCLHTGSLACVTAPGRDAVARAVRKAVAAGVPVSYDPNIRPALSPDRQATRAMVEEFVALADIVKASEEDLSWLWPDRPAHEILNAWSRRPSGAPRLAVMTRGGEGAVAAYGGRFVEQAARQVQVVDTIGAGDTFMAGLLVSLSQQGRLRPDLTLDAAELDRALQYAVAAAAVVCTRPGADPPYAHEL